MAQGKLNIFIIDDDKMMSMLLCDHLESQGRYNVSVYNTGEEALKNIFDAPDVMILDYHLDSEVSGAKNGIEILDEVKKRNKNIKVIMLSSQEQYSVATQSIMKGAIHYVIKGTESFGEIDRFLSGI